MGRNIQKVLGIGASTYDLMPTPLLAQRAPVSTDKEYPEGQVWIDKSANPNAAYIYVGEGVWDSGGNALATNTVAGIFKIDTDGTFASADDDHVPTVLAAKTYADNLAIAGSPVSTETTAGIGQLATDAEAVAGTPSTGVLALFLTPSNLAAVFAAPPAQGGTTPAAGTFTSLTASGGTVSLTSSGAAGLFDVTGAGIDLTLSSDAGRVIVNGEEAADNAITLLSAAGGIDADAALQINIATSETDADSFVMTSGGGLDITATGAAGKDIDIVCTSGSLNLTAGESIATSMVFTNNGMDIVTTGAAGRDIDITNTGGSINIVATENNSGAVIVQTNGGASERITLLASQGTGADSINLESTAGGITLSAALASADAINLSASAGGVDIDGALQVNIASSQNAGDAIRIVASAGGIDVDAVGAAGEDISIVNTGGSLTLQATESDVNAIVINASGVAGGINIDSGTSGFIVDTTGAISLDSAAASNFTATGAFDITIQSTAGSILLNAGEAAADSINIDAGSGGLDVDVALQLNLDSSQAAAANSVRIVASAADGGMDIDSGTGGMTLDSTGAISIDGAAASNFAVSGAGIDLTLDSAAGRLVLTGGEAATDAVRVQADDAAGGIDIDSGTGGITIDSTGVLSIDSAGTTNLTATGAFDLTVQSTAGSVIVSASEDAADALQLLSTAGGIDILATGAAAQDIDIVNTGGSVNIMATENVSTAIVINASGAASGASIDAGTAGLTIGTGMIHAVTAVVTGVDASPYAALGTDYLIAVDTGAGVMTITLPAAPETGRTYVIYDAGGAAAGSNITIDGNGNNIAAAGTSAATKPINTAYESMTLYFDGTLWLGQNVV